VRTESSGRVKFGKNRLSQKSKIWGRRRDPGKGGPGLDRNRRRGGRITGDGGCLSDKWHPGKRKSQDAGEKEAPRNRG